QNQNQRNFAQGNGTAGNRGAQIRAGNVNASQRKLIKCFNYNTLGHIARNCTRPKHQQNFDNFKDKMLPMQAQENGAADECDAFDSDVDDEPTAQSIFMANFSSAGPTNQQAGPSNASILYEVHDIENAIDPCDDNQDEHEIHNEAKRAQSKLYDGNKLLQTHRVPVVVTSSEEDLELAETKRIKMNEKMNDHVGPDGQEYWVDTQSPVVELAGV
nr:hypothetical protein [Tanacetum cinerariifolium]